MGQYYMPLVIREDGTMVRAYSHQFGNGLKLMEHSWVGNNFVNAVLRVLYKNPGRLAWIGDYSVDAVMGDDYGGQGSIGLDGEEGTFVTPQDFQTYYDAAWSEEKGAPYLPADTEGLPLSEETFLARTFYVVDHTTCQYINMSEYALENNENGWIVNPVPLLTCIGNGLGGGDYRERSLEHEDVGEWAFDVISIEDEAPEGYMAYMPHFSEP